MEYNGGFDAIEKIWHSTMKVQSKLYDPEISMGLFIFERLKKDLNNVLQISDTDECVVTNEQMLTWAVSIAQHFKSTFALNHNDVVGIAAVNATYLLPVKLACLFNATPFHGFNSSFPKETLEYILNITKPKVVFCDSQNYERVVAATLQFQPVIYILCGHVEGVASVEDLLTPLTIDTVLSYEPTPLVEGANQTIGIISSSGTSGPPKAACLSNEGFSLTNCFLNENDVLYAASSIDWGSGIHSCLLSCFTNCTRIITTEPYSVENFVRMVKKYKITYATLVYFHTIDLIHAPNVLNTDLDNLRVVMIAGARISITSLRQLKKILRNAKLKVCYGISEFGLVTSQITDGSTESTGQLMPGVSACIVDDDDQRRLGPNEIGEIWFKNNRKWKGYYNNPEATKQLMDSSNWYHSGDIGYFDDNQQLYICDRKSDLCRYRGMIYSPSEIQGVISELADVIDVSVVGVNNEMCGQAATAAVVKRPNSSLTTHDIIEHVKQRLEVPYKQLHGGVFFFDQLPYNRNGKQLRRIIVEMIQQQNAVKNR